MRTIRTERDYNVLVFWLGFIFFGIGITIFIMNVALVLNGHLPDRPWLFVFNGFFSALFIYTGLALLLQAGLKSFHNKLIDLAEEPEKEEIKE